MIQLNDAFQLLRKFGASKVGKSTRKLQSEYTAAR